MHYAGEGMELVGERRGVYIGHRRGEQRQRRDDRGREEVRETETVHASANGLLRRRSTYLEKLNLETTAKHARATSFFSLLPGQPSEGRIWMTGIVSGLD